MHNNFDPAYIYERVHRQRVALVTYFIELKTNNLIVWIVVAPPVWLGWKEREIVCAPLIYDLSSPNAGARS